MNTVKNQLMDSLKREGKTIETYYTKEKFRCIFRKNRDNNSTTEHITIYYETTAPVKQGQLLTFLSKEYLVLNKESVENDTYFRSSLLECNLKIPVTINYIPYQIPCYAYKLSSAKVIEGDVLTTLDGNGEIITEATEPIININISGDKVMRIMGRWFKVINAYNLNGIGHIFTEITTAQPDDYKLLLTVANTNVEIDTTSQITALTLNRDEVVENQIITFSSSDTSIAIVNTNGIVTFLKNGTVVITGTWVEKNLTNAISYTVTGGVIQYNYTMTITPSGSLSVGGIARTYRPKLFNENNIELTGWTATWSFNYGTDIMADRFIVTYDGNNCLVKVASDTDYNLVGKTIVLTCTDEASNTTKSYSVKIGI